MNEGLSMHRVFAPIVIGCLALQLLNADAQKPEEFLLFNGKDLTGWKLRTPESDKRKSKWTVAGGVKLQAGMPERLQAESGTGVLLCGEDGRGIDLLTEQAHGDCVL